MNEVSLCQRWRNGRDGYRPAGEVIDVSRYAVAPVEEVTAKAFVERHHYSGSYPAARHRVGLFRKRPYHQDELVGVAVFSVPMNNAVIRAYTGLSAEQGCELGRFVLLDDVEANGETWFLARALRSLVQAKPKVRGVVSYSDPMPRHTATGEVVLRGHVGTIYAASNAAYLGRSRPRTLLLTPSGTVLNERTLSKIRLAERGQEYAYEQLRRLGAPARREGESGAAYVARVASMPGMRRVRHRGNHVYAFAVGNDHATRDVKERISSCTAAYPKRLDPAA